LENDSGEVFEIRVEQVSDPDRLPWVAWVTYCFQKSQGWKLFTQQKQLEMPTKPGIYADRFERFWGLKDSGRWVGSRRIPNDTPTEADLPLTWLRPEGEEARDILKKIQGMTRRQSWDGLLGLGYRVITADALDELFRSYGLDV
jgi:hypothetical protein